MLYATYLHETMTYTFSTVPFLFTPITEHAFSYLSSHKPVGLETRQNEILHFYSSTK